MSRPKYTEGRWRISKDHNRKSLQVVGELDELICECHYHYKFDDPNAKIIIRVPEMIDVMNRLLAAESDVEEEDAKEDMRELLHTIYEIRGK